MAAVFTPCHGERVLLARERAVAQAVLDVRCPHEGRMWLLALVPPWASS